MTITPAISNIDTVDSPALIVDEATVAHNIREAVAISGHADRLRPHVKTHKIPEISRMMLRSGIRKYKCATTAEADMLASSGAPDILLAYQPVGPRIDRCLTWCVSIRRVASRAL